MTLLPSNSRALRRLQGGGNCGNALTAAARLGLSPACVTKIGGDGVGDGIIAEFQRDGVDTQFVLRASGAPSPFTYIIVVREGGCIRGAASWQAAGHRVWQHVEQRLLTARLLQLHAWEAPAPGAVGDGHQGGDCCLN